MDFKIFNGRKAFYQWDIDQKIIILNANVSNFEIHFKSFGEQYCIVREPYNYNGQKVVDVPNVLLQKTDKIVLWVFVDGTYTNEQATFEVIPKQKPVDYAVTDKEILIYRTLENKINEVEGKAGVTSVNGKKGAVSLGLDDLGAGDYNAIKDFTINRETFSHSGELVKFDSYSGCPLNVVTRIEPVQAGSGDPSPSNIRPITGRAGAVLTRCGKNLIDSVPDKTETSKGVTFSPSADGFGTKIQGTSTDTYAQNASGRYYTLILPPGDYIFSAKLEGNYGNANVGFIYRLNNANAGTVDVTGSVKLLHLDSETKINWFAYVQQSGVTVDCTAYLRLELGSTVTTFEPYQGETFSAPFGQTVYGGTLDWNKGEMVVDRGYMELTGSEGWEAASSAPNAYYINQASDPVLVANVYPGDFYTEYFHSCSHYKANVYSSPIPNGICTIYSGGGGTTIMFRDDRCTSVDAFKAYLAAQKTAGTPVQLAYKLATPTTIQLSENDLHALEGENIVYCDGGETTVSGRKDIVWLTDHLINKINDLKKAIVALGGNV